MLTEFHLSGYKALTDIDIAPEPLEVIVGPNGSGKTSFFEFLRFISRLADRDIPPEIISGQQWQNIFSPETQSINCTATFNFPPFRLHYNIFIQGSAGNPTIPLEELEYNDRGGEENNSLLFRAEGANAYLHSETSPSEGDSVAKRKNQSALLFVQENRHNYAYLLKENFLGWRFYSSFKFFEQRIRLPVLLEQEPSLNEDCSNLSSVLHYFMTEHPQVFQEIQFHLKQLVPGFSHLTVKARGGPGEVMAFWREQGVEQDLSLADLSDGILRLLCWMALFLHPKPPTLICIDEPDLGVHPRTLPLLAGLIKKASMRTQIFVTTHNSYFLSQFALENITVFRKENGATKAHKPKDSETLRALLDEFGQADIANMHITEELELL